MSVQATGWRRRFAAHDSYRDMRRKVGQFLKERERQDNIPYMHLGFGAPRACLIGSGGVQRIDYLLGLREMQTLYLLSPDIER